MKFAIQVKSAPYQHQASDSAYHFACALLAAGHELVRVFFYHDGVNVATRLATPPGDERNLSALWSRLADQHGTELVVCVAAAQRRGIVDASEQRRHGKDSENLAPGFVISGLGQLIDMALVADRLVEFGD